MLNLYQIGVLSDSPIIIEESSNKKKFWNSFSKSLDTNIRGMNGKQRILSIIADEFKYKEIESELKVLIYFLI